MTHSKRVVAMRCLVMAIFFLALFGNFSVTPVKGEDKAKENVFKAETDKDGLQKVEIIGGSYFFRPNHVIVRINVPVELIVRKEPGIVPHDIAMKSPEAGMDFKEALHEEPQIIRFTPIKTGIYPFYCDKKLLFFESHREKGMQGTIEVIN